MTDQPILHDYKISFYREDKTSGGCVRDSRTIKAWTAQDAVFQFELTGRTYYANDKYFRVLEIEPVIPEGTVDANARLIELEKVVVLVDNAISHLRLSSADQNPMGWRDLLGAAAGRIRKERGL